MEQIIKLIMECMKQGENLVLVTVIHGNGSIPRGAGAKMLVNKEQILTGTIGGGAIEYRAEQLAKEALAKKESFVRRFSLGGENKEELGMICGGDVTIYFQYINSENKPFLELCEKVKKAFLSGINSWLVTDITDENNWKVSFFNKEQGIIGEKIENNGKIQVKTLTEVNINGRRYICDSIINEGKLYIFGGGHVAQELVPIAAHVGFRCIIFDDRKEYANGNLFPDAEELIIGDFEHILDKVKITSNDYTAVMSRGHQYDYLLQKQLLMTEAYYIGVMGSRKKLHILEEKLLKEGFTHKDLGRFQSPIGTAILAETPAEIAISIVSELIRVRAMKREEM